MKQAWLAPAGALLALFVAGGAALGFVRWRTSEQKHALETHTSRCRSGAQTSCDWLRNACQKRAAEACWILAESYRTGQGVAQSNGEALALGDDGCRLGEADACVMVGTLLRDESGGPQQAERATAAFERACRLGNQQACSLASPK